MADGLLPHPGLPHDLPALPALESLGRCPGWRARLHAHRRGTGRGEALAPRGDLQQSG
ncbi:hypothetical protein ACFFX0_18390 [Citricoccus parietis]|uniref:Uncharacterized protein n=1 Tax=Citricoccus parietis TaxID=592307 RepID=A0ABV5G2A5_9MICC